MPYDENLVQLLRTALAEAGTPGVVEKKMFGSRAFLVWGKIFINVIGHRFMCRYHPEHHAEVCRRHDYQPKIMRGKEMKNFCTVDPADFRSEDDFYYWLHLCLACNERLAG